jgi:hypothetical protein
MSIWDGVDRDEMWQNLRLLALNGKYQHESQLPSIKLNRSSSNNDESSKLSPQDERQLADDFAFLSCVTKEPRAVSAAAILIAPSPPHVVVTIAANEGISPQVIEKLQELLDTLQLRASRIRSRKETLSICRNTIISLHQQRILTRLASVKVSLVHI